MLTDYSCRRLISLRVRDGLSYRDIAARLGRTEQGVRAKMYKCLKQARALLETEGRTVHAGEGSGE